LKSILPSLKFLSIASSVLFLQGCVGIGVAAIGDYSNTVQDPAILRSKGEFQISAKPDKEAFGSDLLLSYWGSPDNRDRIDGGREIWEYQFGKLRWHGVLVYILVVPVPFMIPFGHDYVTLIIEDGHVKSAARTGSNTKFSFFCGYTALFHQKGPWVCGSDTK
jgi:hypothetical protein